MPSSHGSPPYWIINQLKQSHNASIKWSLFQFYVIVLILFNDGTCKRVYNDGVFDTIVQVSFNTSRIVCRQLYIVCREPVIVALHLTSKVLYTNCSYLTGKVLENRTYYNLFIINKGWFCIVFCILKLTCNEKFPFWPYNCSVHHWSTFITHVLQN